MTLRSGLRAALVLFLLFPFLFLFTQFQITEVPDISELWWAFKNSFLQAFFSAFFSLLIGFWISLGLVSSQNFLKGRFGSFFEILCLAPNFLPPLFIILATLSVVEPFPMGTAGIVLIHTLMNFGLAAVLLSGLIESKIGGMAELAYIEGASRFQFITKGVLPLLRKDILLLGLFVFVICFGSFSVPLIVGGGRGTTIEVLIYEKIRLSSQWGDAVLLAFLQSGFIFVLSFLNRKGHVPVKHGFANLKILSTPSGLLVLLLLSSLYLFGYFEGWLAGLQLLTTFYGMEEVLIKAFLGSLYMGLTVALATFALLMLIAYCTPKRWFQGFLHAYVAPSTALACFSLLIWGPNEGFYAYIKIPVALTLLSLTGLYRMGWESDLTSLQGQSQVAYSMGASPEQIFKEILLPQLCHRAGMLSGIAAIWACGDFAVSRILAHRDLTIAMMTETLMSGYRLNQAIVLSSLIIIAGILCFFICVGGSRVLRRKLTS